MPDDSAWLDDLGLAFHAAIRAARPRGRMTYQELDAVLPDGDYTSRQIEILFAHVARQGIELVEDGR